MVDDKEVNLGGRPPIYPASEENYLKVSNLCQEYFTYIKGEKEKQSKEEGKENEPDEYIIIRMPEPPTVTGLTLFLGFESKNTLYEYGKKEGFSDSIKKALTRIEQHHEIAASYGDKCVGNIFILKNFGWKDTQAIDHTTAGQSMESTRIEFRKTDG